MRRDAGEQGYFNTIKDVALRSKLFFPFFFRTVTTLSLLLFDVSYATTLSSSPLVLTSVSYPRSHCCIFKRDKHQLFARKEIPCIRCNCGAANQ